MTQKLQRSALSLLAATVLSCAGAPPQPPPPPAATTAPPAAAPAPAKKDARFTILQINDVYRIEGIENGSKGGMSRVRALRKELEREGRPVLVLHAGDLLFPSVMSKFLKGEPMVKVLNLLDGDPAAPDPHLVVTFGNHEFDDKDPGVILGRLAESDFSWVSSNVRYVTAKGTAGEPFSRRVPSVHDTLVLDLDGTRVGILGLTTNVQPRDYVAYDYGKEGAPDEAVRPALARLAEAGAQVRIALTHQDLDEDERLAGRFPEIDLVVGGHEHLFLERKVGHTWITKADADAVTALVHDVHLHDGTVETSHRLVHLDARAPGDPTVDAAVKQWLGALAATVKERTGGDLSEKVGETANLLEGLEPAVRGRETALGDFLTDVMRDRMKTDLAILNGGAIRLNDNIPPGPVTRYDLEGIFYFPDTLVTFELSGAELLDVLRHGVARVHSGGGQFLQVSSIRFRYHPGGTPEHPTYRIDPSDVEVRPRGAAAFAPLDPARRYSVATVSYERGDLCEHVVASCKGKALPPGTVAWRKATEEAIAALPGRRITSAVEGRIARAEK